MAISYRDAGQTVRDLVTRIISKHHPDLYQLGVNVGVLFAESDKPGVRAVKLHGYPCLAIVRKTGVRQRLLGGPDAEIVLDYAHWQQAKAAERAALIDHELYHLVVLRDKKSGATAMDDAKRPKLKLANHDWEIGGFEAIVKRHGEAAPEYQQAKALREQYGQLLFDFDSGGDVLLKAVASA